MTFKDCVNNGLAGRKTDVRGERRHKAPHPSVLRYPDY